MAFKLVKGGSYKWPVKFSVAQDGGGYEVMTFDAEFKRIGRDEFHSLMDDAEADESSVKLLREVMIGWTGILDGEGNEVPFSETNREALFNFRPGLPLQISRCYFESIAADKVKN